MPWVCLQFVIVIFPDHTHFFWEPIFDLLFVWPIKAGFTVYSYVVLYFLQIFRGNSDADTHVEEELDCPVFAKGIRLYPLEWESHIALRFDVKGCYLDNNALGKIQQKKFSVNL